MNTLTLEQIERNIALLAKSNPSATVRPNEILSLVKMPETITRTPVESSNVKAIGFDEDSKVMEVEFHGGGIYRYLCVPKEKNEALLNDTSVGRAFNSMVKPNHSAIKMQ